LEEGVVIKELLVLSFVLNILLVFSVINIKCDFLKLEEKYHKLIKKKNKLK
jgi:hypothetical protein